jgi:lipopolysaccharide/colanic/teichoic acid biosynthesis glycosyltransferase
MRLWPVILDGQPPFLASRRRKCSLLFVPLGADTLLGHFAAWLEPLTNAPLTLVAPMGAEAEQYAGSASSLCSRVGHVCTSESFADTLGRYELSDALLLLDATCLVMQRRELAVLAERHALEPRALHHLVAFETGLNETRERVSFDAAGCVRGVHRHYAPTTWPFIAGVSATILPVACAVVGERPGAQRLADLRQQFVGRGVPTCDLPIDGGALNLNEEAGLLAASESFILQSDFSRGRNGTAMPMLVGTGQWLHPTARIIGPVVVHADAIIDEHAMVVGPVTIGAGARVGAGAIVAEAIVGVSAVVRPGVTVHGRVWLEQTDSAGLLQPDVPHGGLFTRPVIERHALDGFDLGRDRSSHGRLKRLIDVLVSVAALAVLAPAICVIALVLWLTSGRPIFYGDEREGLGGRVFRCWKFRTMSTKAHAAQQDLGAMDQVDGPHFKVARDPRVTPIGRILRASNLDEVPQLLNVLVGEMSLVGPRPSPFRENQICVPWREARISVRPGITGLWQVCRHNRAAGDFHQWIEYDVLYVRRMSLALDLKILLATVLTLGGKATHVRSSWLVPERPSRVERLPDDDAVGAEWVA